MNYIFMCCKIKCEAFDNQKFFLNGQFNGLMIAQFKMETVVVGFTAPISAVEMFSFLKAQRRGYQFIVLFCEEYDGTVG